jgi:hypothetical protein
MPWIAATVTQGNATITGHTYWTRAEQDEFREFTVPGDLDHVGQYGSHVNYRNRLYICGQYTDNVVLDEHMRMHRLGIAPPTERPTIAAGPGTGITASDVIGYVTFYDELTGERSSLSGGSATIALANKDVLWTDLPTESNDPRVTHIELWRSVDGALPRLAVRRHLGVTSVTENIATLALGEALVTTFERFPRCAYNAIYHDRHVLSGNPEHPDELYLSGIFLPERYEGLSFKTRQGEPIVGMINVRDMLLVLCPESSYILQGYSETDMVFSVSEPELGGINHFQVDLAHGNAIIANRKSTYLFNGAWHNIMLDGQMEWRAEQKADHSQFEMAYARYDPVSHRFKYRTGLANTLMLDIPGRPQASSNDLSLYWCADLQPVLPELAGGFAQPNWSFDVRDRGDTVMARLALPGYAKTGFYVATSLGRIYAENEEDNTNDYADAYAKRFSVRTGAVLMSNPGGDIEEGKSFSRTWVHVEAEQNAWDLYLWGGDEQAWMQQRLELTPSAPVYDNAELLFKATVPASEARSEFGGAEVFAVPQSVHAFVTEGVAGRGLTALFTAANPNRMVFRGFGGWYGPGPVTRGPWDAITPGLARQPLRRPEVS